MRYSRTIALAVCLFIGATVLQAQNPIDLRVTEAVVENESGLVDDFGERNGWIEIFNNSNGTVKFAGCYLSDDRNNLKKYHIPTSDRSTQVGPRQSVVFYACGNASHGTFHTNFTLEKGETIYLVSNDGKTIIDQLEIPATLQSDKSVKKVPVGVKETDFETESNSIPTPGSYNGDLDAKSNSEIMKEKDPHGFVLAIISISTVFIALFVLSLIFGWIGRAQKRQSGGKKAAAVSKPSKKAKPGDVTPEVAAAISLALQQEFGGEVYAAIALALDDYLGGGIHDSESFIITIKPSGSSQWNGKVQNFRKLPR